MEYLDLDRGVTSWARLRHRGVTRPELERALADGSVRRLRRGWYAIDGAHPVVVEAVLGDGVCSCLSALRLHGVWVPTDRRTHIRARNSAHNRHGARFCHRHGRPLPETTAVDDVPIALAHAVRCLDAEGTVVVLDSIRNLGLMTSREVETALAETPLRVRRLLDRCDQAESGTESMVRLRLRARRIGVRPQITIPGLGRVDLLVGSRLIIEVDSEEFHLTPEQWEKDHQRDRQAALLGYERIRLTYRDVVFGWARVEGQILDLIRREKHRYPALESHYRAV
ncbi:MAG: hypothetical protein QM774_08130 [Gordonia sp. (in: high G+C Gram-positive bacteria)]|uniref:hypothetical protein n=1 Tax=Gordonia sp. (in: high G+C Gram-positive bacteria) TaxID=84139 RepID=UPI0039E674C9